ncbi:MAG: serine/threonine protein kinase [Deltaproteobacteria bacterium]|nr:serine/threonine protein kinase [Deltaproteobacteria bacterium]
MHTTSGPLPTSAPDPSPLDEVAFPDNGTRRDRFGAYDLIALLGQEPMANVYLASARRGLATQGRLVLLKVLREPFRSDPACVDRFTREARLALDLVHPNIGETYDLSRIDGIPYLVAEYLDGVSLRTLLDRLPFASLRDRLPLLGVLCMALSGLHHIHRMGTDEGEGRGLVHGDFRPSNILITFDGEVKLLDVGSTSQAGPSTEAAASQIRQGVVRYIAPEAVDTDAFVDARADIFAAGLIAWEIATGQPVWGHCDQLDIVLRLVSGDVPNVDEQSSELPDELFAICRQAMSPRARGRQATALEFNRQLKNFLVGQDFRIDTERLGKMLRELFGSGPAVQDDVVGGE